MNLWDVPLADLEDDLTAISPCMATSVAKTGDKSPSDTMNQLADFLDTRFRATLWGLDVLATDGMGEHESKPDIEAQLDTVNSQSHLPEATFDLRQPLARRNELSDIVPSSDYPFVFTTSARSTGTGGTSESFINEANLTCSREDEKLETWIGRYLTLAELPPIKLHRPTFKDTRGAIEESSEYLSYLACTGIDEWLQLR